MALPPSLSKDGMNDYVYYNNDDHHDAFRFSGQQFTKTFIKVIIKQNI